MYDDFYLQPYIITASKWKMIQNSFRKKHKSVKFEGHWIINALLYDVLSFLK